MADSDNHTSASLGTAPATPVKRPIRRSVLIGGFGLLVLLCTLLSALSYLVFSTALYDRCDSKLANVITYVENNTDADDLALCVQTGEHSQKYDQLQQFLNGIVDDFELDYLYIVIPGENVMINACSATSAKEFAAGETDMPLLEETDAYTPEMLQRFRSFWDTDTVNYFEESSDYGIYYTASKPLRDSKGETVALICADVSVDTLHENINHYLLGSTAIIVVVFGFAAAFALYWLRRNVTDPLFALEKRAREFIRQIHESNDLSTLRFEAPAIDTENEVQSLSEAIQQLADDMQDQAQQTLAARKQASKAEEEFANKLSEAHVKANVDALTGVRNKRSYDGIVKKMDQQIADGEADQFAIVVCDVNELKNVNDTKGHQAGDDVIKQACSMICNVFKHSPVFRVGGDEFAVIARGHDYENVDALVGEVARINEASQADGESVVACGMSRFEGDSDVATVFARADHLMYENKKALKGL